jgi:hypothetical protein
MVFAAMQHNWASEGRSPGLVSCARLGTDKEPMSGDFNPDHDVEALRTLVAAEAVE